jgi:hypothetical protein
MNPKVDLYRVFMAQNCRVRNLDATLRRHRHCLGAIEMGRTSITGGVTAKGEGRIQFTFRFESARYRPTMPILPTEANLRRAPNRHRRLYLPLDMPLGIGGDEPSARKNRQ